MRAKKTFKDISNTETAEKMQRFLTRCFEDVLTVNVTVEYEDPDLQAMRAPQTRNPATAGPETGTGTSGKGKGKTTATESGTS